MVLLAIIIVLITGAFCHFLIKKFWVATITSTIWSTFVIWTVAIGHFGWFDRVFYKNLTITLVITFTGALIIGVLFKVIRKDKREINNEI